MPRSRYFRQLSERGRRMAKARWKRHRAEIDRQIEAGEIPEPVEPWPLDRPYYTIPIIHHGSDTIHIMRLYPSRTGRRDQFRVTVDGEEWQAAIGLTGVMQGIRKAMFRQG